MRAGRFGAAALAAAGLVFGLFSASLDRPSLDLLASSAAYAADASKPTSGFGNGSALGGGAAAPAPNTGSNATGQSSPDADTQLTPAIDQTVDRTGLALAPTVDDGKDIDPDTGLFIGHDATDDTTPAGEAEEAPEPEQPAGKLQLKSLAAAVTVPANAAQPGTPRKSPRCLRSPATAP